MSDPITYDSRVLYSIKEARVLLGGISQTTVYALLRTGELASVVIGCRRFISKDAISEFVKRATITDGPVRENLSRNIIQRTLSLPVPSAIVQRPRPRGRSS
jgi:excisionase family DNA binding protein